MSRSAPRRSDQRRPDQPRHSLLRRVATHTVVATAAIGLLAVVPLSGQFSQDTASAKPDREGRLTRDGQARMGWNRAADSTPIAPTKVTGTTPGLDVSGHDGDVDWKSRWNNGYRFVYVKATEGTSFVNSAQADQVSGARAQGMYVGAYHFARPANSSGAEQARWFVKNGGAWKSDGKTLPGVLDIEYNPYGGNICYGLSRSDMVAWIKDFTSTYTKLTGRDTTIYTTTDWWKQCTGDTTEISGELPLWLARYANEVGDLPAAWDYETVWQHAETPYDQNLFNGSIDRVRALAEGDKVTPSTPQVDATAASTPRGASKAASTELVKDSDTSARSSKAQKELVDELTRAFVAASEGRTPDWKALSKKFGIAVTELRRQADELIKELRENGVGVSGPSSPRA